MDKTAIMICGHGSLDVDSITEFELVVAGLKARLSDYPLTHGFLEFAIAGDLGLPGVCRSCGPIAQRSLSSGPCQA